MIQKLMRRQPMDPNTTLLFFFLAVRQHLGQYRIQHTLNKSQMGTIGQNINSVFSTN